MPTYQITADATVINEGSTATFNIIIEDGSTSTYGLTIASASSLTTILNASDFEPIGGMWETFTLTGGLTSGVASVSRTLRADSSDEDPEYFVMQLREYSTSGSVVAVSQNITVVDISTGGIVDDPENGKLRALTADNSKPAYYVNGVWYKVSGTAIPL